MPCVKERLNPVQISWPYERGTAIYSNLQVAGLEAVQWICAAHIVCATNPHTSWEWDDVDSYDQTVSYRGLSWNFRDLLQNADPRALALHPTDPRSQLIKSNPVHHNKRIIPSTPETNTDRQLILHPTMSSFTHAVQPTSPATSNYNIDDLLTCNFDSMMSPSPEPSTRYTSAGAMLGNVSNWVQDIAVEGERSCSPTFSSWIKTEPLDDEFCRSGLNFDMQDGTEEGMSED
ncbi:hypothetical protein DXG01_000897 [Tephrocybe rancida]|nr:hypothetical protein DXG01_000897 [Tephrocybe rancida]